MQRGHGTNMLQMRWLQTQAIANGILTVCAGWLKALRKA